MKQEDTNSAPPPTTPSSAGAPTPASGPSRSLRKALLPVLLAGLTLAVALLIIRWGQMTIDATPPQSRRRPSTLAASEANPDAMVNSNPALSPPGAIENFDMSDPGTSEWTPLPEAPAERVVKKSPGDVPPLPLGANVMSSFAPEGMQPLAGEPLGLQPIPGAVRLNGFQRDAGGFHEEMAVWEIKGLPLGKVIEHYETQARAAKFKDLTRARAKPAKEGNQPDGVPSKTEPNVRTMSRLFIQPLASSDPTQHANLTLSIRAITDTESQVTTVTLWLRKPVNSQ